MADTAGAVFDRAIRALAEATIAASAGGHARVADATIEVQYVITSRVRPWLDIQDVPTSTYTVLEYTVKGLEAQVALHLPFNHGYTHLAEFEACMAAARDPVAQTLCLTDHATRIAERFLEVVGTK